MGRRIVKLYFTSTLIQLLNSPQDRSSPTQANTRAKFNALVRVWKKAAIGLNVTQNISAHSMRASDNTEMKWLKTDLAVINAMMRWSKYSIMQRRYNRGPTSALKEGISHALTTQGAPPATSTVTTTTATSTAT